MPSDVIDRRAMIDELCSWYGTPKDCWTHFDQDVLNVAWIAARAHWWRDDPPPVEHPPSDPPPR